MAKFGGAVRGLPKAYGGNMGPYMGNSPSFKKFVARKDKDNYSSMYPTKFHVYVLS